MLVWTVDGFMPPPFARVRPRGKTAETVLSARHCPSPYSCPLVQARSHVTTGSKLGLYRGHHLAGVFDRASRSFYGGFTVTPGLYKSGRRGKPFGSLKVAYADVKAEFRSMVGRHCCMYRCSKHGERGACGTPYHRTFAVTAPLSPCSAKKQSAYWRPVPPHSGTLSSLHLGAPGPERQRSVRRSHNWSLSPQ